MTIVFDDEDLYTHLKVEAARTHRPAKDIVAEALVLLFDRGRRHRDAAIRFEQVDDIYPGRGQEDGSSRYGRDLAGVTERRL